MRRKNPARTTGDGMRVKAHLERSLKIGDELGGHLVTGHMTHCPLSRAREIRPGDDPWTDRRASPSGCRGLAQVHREKGSVRSTACY